MLLETRYAETGLEDLTVSLKWTHTVPAATMGTTRMIALPTRRHAPGVRLRHRDQSSQPVYAAAKIRKTLAVVTFTSAAAMPQMIATNSHFLDPVARTRMYPSKNHTAAQSAVDSIMNDRE